MRRLSIVSALAAGDVRQVCAFNVKQLSGAKLCCRLLELHHVEKKRGEEEAGLNVCCVEKKCRTKSLNQRTFVVTD